MYETRRFSIVLVSLATGQESGVINESETTGRLWNTSTCEKRWTKSIEIAMGL